MLPSYCYNVRRLIIEDKKNRFYKRSDNQQANFHFDKGNDFMESGDYKNAIKEFESAVKFDNNLVYAIDNLAISYRHLENYKTAIKYYNQSLDIFPEGDVALLNIAVSYSFLEDDENSIKSYSKLKFLYPDDPEGYFGLAKMYFIISSCVVSHPSSTAVTLPSHMTAILSLSFNISDISDEIIIMDFPCSASSLKSS